MIETELTLLDDAHWGSPPWLASQPTTGSDSSMSRL